MYRAQLRWQPIAMLMFLALIWGANWAVVKMTYDELEPLFMAGLRSLVASGCLYIWMRAKGIRIFPSRKIIFHGIMVGCLFGSEFGLIYVGLKYTLASRMYVLIYTAPIFVALGAHIFLKGDRMNPWKGGGLVLAFVGIMALFSKDLGHFSFSALPGDILAMAAGLLWAFTTLYIKKFLAYKTVPLQTLFYQVFFSAPPLLILSFLLENPTLSNLSWYGALSIFYQSIIVAFLSFLAWFHLIHRHPVSLLHAFSFFTPVFGVFLSGALILGETIGMNLILALVFISVGMVLVNHQPKDEADSERESRT
jgi:drug/metabolite transporter (DMT)-like permease